MTWGGRNVEMGRYQCVGPEWFIMICEQFYPCQHITYANISMSAGVISKTAMQNHLKGYLIFIVSDVHYPIL
jgi:hypothetical protein